MLIGKYYFIYRKVLYCVLFTILDRLSSRHLLGVFSTYVLSVDLVLNKIPLVVKRHL
jgi:hypothetical protein